MRVMQGVHCGSSFMLAVQMVVWGLQRHCNGADFVPRL